MIKELKKENMIFLSQIFVIGGIFGFVYEEIFYYFDLGYFVKRGSTFGPWIPIYAFGSILIYLLCKKYKNKPILIFILGSLISGILEFVTGYVLYHFFNLRLWDYNTEILNFCNIGGYICFRSVLFFGISSLFLFYGIIPVLKKICSINNRVINIISIILFLLFIVDIVINIFL